MKEYLLLALLFIFGLLLSNCSIGPDFERGNVNDPKSIEFKPDISSLQVKINNDKTVSLNWVDGSEFEDGFIVGKQLGDTDTMVILDTLPKNTVNYTDDTRQLDLRTTYFVAPFKNETVSEDSLEFKSKRLNFGEFNTITSETSNVNVIKVSWETDMPYADNFVIKKITTNDIIPIDTIGRTESTYSYTELDEVYSVDVYVFALLKNATGDYQEIGDIRAQNIPINLPTNLQVSVIDEETISASWQDNSTFEDEFIIYQRPANSQNSPGSNKYIPLDTLRNHGTLKLKNYEGIFYDLNISPYKQGIVGSKINPVILTLVSRRPDIEKVKSVSESELTLEWSDHNTNNPSEFRFPTKRFVIEQSAEGGAFEILDEIDPSHNSYKVSNLDKALKYRFRVRSLASDHDEIQTVFEKSLETKTEFPLGSSSDYPYRLRSSPQNNHFVYEYARHSGGSYSVRFVNKTSGKIENEVIFDNDFRGYSISKNENLIAIFKGEAPGIYEYLGSDVNLIYDLNNTISGVFLNSEELVIIKGDESQSLIKVNISQNSESIIEDFAQSNDKKDILILDIYPFTFGSKIYLRTNKGNMVYDVENKNSSLILSPDLQITDVNNNGEILLTNKNEAVLYNETGAIRKFLVPNRINYSGTNIEATSANFINDKNIVVGTKTSNQGVIFLYERGSVNYISYALGHSLIVTDKTEESVLSINRFMRGNGYIFDLTEGWTTY